MAKTPKKVESCIKEIRDDFLLKTTSLYGLIASYGGHYPNIESFVISLFKYMHDSNEISGPMMFRCLQILDKSGVKWLEHSDKILNNIFSMGRYSTNINLIMAYLYPMSDVNIEKYNLKDVIRYFGNDIVHYIPKWYGVSNLLVALVASGNGKLVKNIKVPYAYIHDYTGIVQYIESFGNPIAAFYSGVVNVNYVIDYCKLINNKMLKNLSVALSNIHEHTQNQYYDQSTLFDTIIRTNVYDVIDTLEGKVASLYTNKLHSLTRLEYWGDDHDLVKRLFGNLHSIRIQIEGDKKEFYVNLFTFIEDNFFIPPIDTLLSDLRFELSIELIDALDEYYGGSLFTNKFVATLQKIQSSYFPEDKDKFRLFSILKKYYNNDVLARILFYDFGGINRFIKLYKEGILDNTVVISDTKGYSGQFYSNGLDPFEFNLTIGTVDSYLTSGNSRIGEYHHKLFAHMKEKQYNTVFAIPHEEMVILKLKYC